MRVALTPGGKLFLAVWLVYSLCPPFSGYDSYYVVPTALSLIDRHTTAVDPYVPGAPPISLYAVECVPPHGPALAGVVANGCVGGHWYDYFPVSVPVLAAPLVLAIRWAVQLVHVVAPAAARIPQPIVAAFFAGDFVQGRALVEMLCAAFFGALAVWLQYRIAARFLPVRQAVWLVVLFAFGTAEWSTASRSLTQHGLSVLCLSLVTYLMVLAQETPSRIALAAIPVAVAFTVRPSNCVAVAMVTLCVAVHYRRYLLRYVAMAAPVAAIFFAYNLAMRHSLFPHYYNVNSPELYPPVAGFLMNLFSPSRGLLLFTPIVLFSALGVVLAVRSRWCFPVAPYLAGIVVLHALLISRYWGGHSYGPRYFSDMSSLFVFFLIPAVLYWQKMHGRSHRAAAAAFLMLAVWSVFVQFRGATSVAANQWSATPDLDHAKWRVWDWHDPQFLRGLH